MQQPILENMKLTQNFSYNESTKIWAKNIQSLEFSAGIFGMKFTGKFTHVFSNYIFKEAFEKKTFGKEIVTFADNANKKEESFWNEFRPVPLTTEEATNYVKKDSIQTVRKSETYLDSIDAKGNKFKIHKLITGYTYKKTFKKWSFNYQGMTNLSSLSFNTVQGWNLDSGFSFRKWDEETGKYTYISSTFNYGFAEDRVRVNGRYYHRFNNKNNAYIAIAGGSSINQFNSNEPISNIVNSVSTLFFKNNFIKLYNKEFAEISYGREVTNGVYVSGKINIQNDDYPILSFNYEKAFGATNNDYHYDLISASVDYNKTIGNKGDFGLRFKAGKFFNAENISFIDYKHFNGNQTHVNLLNNSLNSFNLLPYYSHSTNDAYFETHIEHNFKGYIMNKIPLLNKLQWNLIGGFHQINIPDRKPYQEVTVGFDNIGWGKLRFLRIDYVRSYQNGFQGDGIMFGVKF